MLQTLRLTPLLSIVLSAASAVPATAITSTPSWKPREGLGLADYSPLDGADRMLAYDHHGNPGITFSDNSDGSLEYARRVAGVGWVNAEVDPNFSFHPSLAYDRYERPAISYAYPSFTTPSLRYAHFDGASWQLETVDAVESSSTSLAFDVYGHPAIAYTADPNFSLKYVHDTDGDFSLADETPVTVISDLGAGFWPSLAFDNLNRPMIGHTNAFTSEVLFSVEEPGLGWISTTVDTYTSSSALTSLAIDPNTGYPAIAHAGSSDGVRFAAWDGDAWDITPVDPNASLSARVSMAFDPSDGNPVITYGDLDDKELRFAWHDGSSWQIQTVDSPGEFLQSSVAFNDFGNGFASIAYVNSSNQLYFIEDPPATVPEPASALLILASTAALLVRRPDTNL